MPKMDEARRTEMEKQMPQDIRTRQTLIYLIKLMALYEKKHGADKPLAMASSLFGMAAQKLDERGEVTLNEAVQLMGFSGGIAEAERVGEQLPLSAKQMKEIMEVWDMEDELWT
jgi:hypothetical protein